MQDYPSNNSFSLDFLNFSLYDRLRRKEKGVIFLTSERDLLSRIQGGMSEFSKGQKLIANFIINHYDKAAFMTASKLGTTVGVSESTVVRFAIELGFEGYPHLQKSLQELIRTKLTSVQRIDVTNDRLGDSNILKNVVLSDIDKMRASLEEMDYDSFNRRGCRHRNQLSEILQ